MEPARSISKPPAFVAESNQVEVKVFVWMEGNLISCGSMFFENCGDLSLLKNWKKIKSSNFEAILRETWKKRKKTSRFLLLTTNPLTAIYNSIIMWYCELFSSSESHNFFRLTFIVDVEQNVRLLFFNVKNRRICSARMNQFPSIACTLLETSPRLARTLDVKLAQQDREAFSKLPLELPRVWPFELSIL